MHASVSSMDFDAALLFVAGLLLIAAALFDALRTTISTDGGGAM